MLFPYAEIKHPMRRMQLFITYIFRRVWCRAPTVEYSMELFRGLPPLHAIMLQLDREDKAGKEDGAGAFFFKHVNLIFNDFKELTPQEIATYKKAFAANNDIEGLCAGVSDPTRYESLARAPLMKDVREFFSKLYGCGFFSLALVRHNIGADLRSHYRAFVAANKPPSCPFCGLIPIDTEHDPTRDPYDHYFPSSLYPFNSVNLKNLVPSCTKCNSGNKLGQDPLIDEQGIRRKAFYPFSRLRQNIEFQVALKTRKLNPLEPDALKIEFKCEGHEEEIGTWDRLYRVKKRYAARCCANGPTVWLARVLEECKNYGLPPRRMLTAELRSCDRNPWTEASFLKAAFLRACDQQGLISSRSSTSFRGC